MLNLSRKRVSFSLCQLVGSKYEPDTYQGLNKAGSNKHENYAKIKSNFKLETRTKDFFIKTRLWEFESLVVVDMQHLISLYSTA